MAPGVRQIVLPPGRRRPRCAPARCPDPSGNQIARVLTQGGGVVSCLVPGFDAAGALDATSFCETYVVLGH